MDNHNSLASSLIKIDCSEHKIATIMPTFIVALDVPEIDETKEDGDPWIHIPQLSDEIWEYDLSTR